MDNEKILKEADRLVDVTIKEHKAGLLGKEKMCVFFEKRLSEDTKVYYNQILMLYCKLLARSGYDIKNNTDNFDIVKY